MDDLDRLFRRLVHNVQGGFPHLLARQFQLSDIAQHLVPYRHNRRELGLETNQDYEHALLRLVSGERGYVLADPTVQDATRRELASADPDPELLRTHGASLVSLAPDAAARADALGPSPSESAAPGADPARASAGTDRAAASGRTPAESAPPVSAAPAQASDASSAGVAGASSESHAVSDAPTASSASLPWTERVVIVTPDGPRSGAGAPPQQQHGADPVKTPNHSDAAATPATPRPTGFSPSAFTEPADGYVTPSSRPTPAVVDGGSCRYCGGALPDGRQVTFCPHCGQNVTIVQCPACSTELELGWKFCITCGRGADAASSAARAP